MVLHYVTPAKKKYLVKIRLLYWPKLIYDRKFNNTIKYYYEQYIKNY